MAATWVRDIWHDKWISFAPKGSILCLSELAFSCKQKIHAKAIFKLKSIHLVADTLWWNYSKNKLHVLQILLLVYWLITVALNYYQDGRPRDRYSYGLVSVGTVQPLSVSVEGELRTTVLMMPSVISMADCGVALLMVVPRLFLDFPVLRGNLYCYDGECVLCMVDSIE